MNRWIDILRLRLRSLVRRGDVDRDLDRELRFHLEQQVAELVAEGRSPEEARRLAMREFGAVDRITEECRDTRRLNVFHNVMQDLRYATRSLVRQPILLVAATASIALGVGANLAIFGLANSLLLSTPSAVRPDRLVVVGMLGALGAVLAMVGLYGVVSFAVARRTAEIGIRLALGASRAAVLRVILKDGGVLVGTGLLVGLGLAFLVTRPLSAFLVAELPAGDPVSFAGSAMLLLLTSLLASWSPARRATRVAPATALRAE